jgi:hypothetical protein
MHVTRQEVKEKANDNCSCMFITNTHVHISLLHSLSVCSVIHPILMSNI